MFALNGRQAYARALAARPDLILASAMLSNMDSIALMRLLHVDTVLKDTPVIFFDDAENYDIRLNGLRSGARDVITIRHREEEVIERIKIHLELVSRHYAEGLALTTVKPDAIEINKLSPTNEQIGPSYDLTIAQAVTKLVARRLYQPYDAVELGKALAVSARRIRRAVKLCLSLSVADYVKHQRMQHAKFLLFHSSLPIAAIAIEVGYSSAANFSTAFSTRFGVTPSAYRRSRR